MYTSSLSHAYKRSESSSFKASPASQHYLAVEVVVVIKAICSLALLNAYMDTEHVPGSASTHEKTFCVSQAFSKFELSSPASSASWQHYVESTSDDSSGSTRFWWESIAQVVLLQVFSQVSTSNLLQAQSSSDSGSSEEMPSAQHSLRSTSSFSSSIPYWPWLFNAVRE